MKYVDVVIDNKSNNTDAFFTYAAPDDVGVGARISVPFARRKKSVDAYCMRENPAPDFDTDKIKEIDAYYPDRSLNEEMISTAIWMRKRYGVKYIDAVKMFTVGGKRPTKRKKKQKDKDKQNINCTAAQKDKVLYQNINKGSENYDNDADNPDNHFNFTKEAAMSATGSIRTDIDPATSATGFIRTDIATVDTDFISADIAVTKSPFILSPEQQHAADRICPCVKAGEFKAFLIKGVTSSGKTEVYMRVAEEALSSGKTVIVLLPEIALAAQVEKRFAERFGDEMVATLHSRLKTSEKLGEWLRIRSGEARIVVGARTSVFAPLENIGAIIIDEEHETTYKSDHNPKYETVDIAYKRASAHGAVLVLGSATPSVVSYNRAESGVYELLEMKERIGGSAMPVLETVDMRQEIRSGNIGVISRRLAAETERVLKKGEQVIYFLNRRGFSTQILCPDCGYRMTCPDCGITLTYHKSVKAAVCHYCGRRFALPDKCPDCGNRFIRYVGAGTEKVEESVRELWPEARVSRFDLDTASDIGDSADVIDDFQNGRTDILVGTQILAKGLDFRNVGLVGIINADVSLNIPDYRSAERTYQLITQVAGRAGRAGGESLVLIQTYDPDSDVIREAASGDYESFYEGELLHRNIMNYPPYSDIIAVGFVSESAEEAIGYAEAFRKRLLELKSAPRDADILRVRLDERKTDGRFRAEFIIKAPPGSRAGYVREYMEYRDRMTESKSACFIEIDINPY